MIRPFTCICMLLAAGSGLYLYQTKHRAQLLDREITRTLKQTDQARERIGALKGEWALLSEPERLNELAGQHLALKTLAPVQFVAMSDLGARLPAPLPPGSNTMPLDEPAPPSMPIAAAKPIQAGPRVAEKPERPTERTADKQVQMAAMPQPALPPTAPAPARAAAKLPAAPVTTPASVPAPGRSAPQQPLAPRIMAPVMNVSAGQIPAPAPGSIGESVARAARVREQAPVMIPASSSAAAYSAPVGNTYGGGAFGGGSALGGAGRVALPAPVPFGAGQR